MTSPLWDSMSRVISHLIPRYGNTYDIGTPELPFRNIYITGDIVENDLTLSGFLKFSGVHGEIRGGTTDLLLEAHDGTINMTVTDAGVVTVNRGNFIIQSSNLFFNAASASIVPGATSLLFRNHVDNANNLTITDAGLVTVVRSNLAVTVGQIIMGAAASQLVPGATSFAIRNNGDSQNNLLVANTGVVTVPNGNLIISTGNLFFGAASASIVPGATSLLFRNNVDNANNLTITDAGIVTVERSNLVVALGNATISAGSLTFGAASAKIIPGVTSLLFRNNADGATNLTIADAGAVTIDRGSLNITLGNIAFAGSTPIIASNATNKSVAICGGSSATAADGAFLILIGSTNGTNAGDATLTAGSNAGGELNLSAQGSGGAIFMNTTTVNLRDASGNSLWTLASSGVFANNSTNGGVIQFNKASTGVADNIATLAALGTDQTNAAPAVATVSRVTGADGTVGVKAKALSAYTTGQEIVFINSSTASALKVYSDAAGETISGQSGTTAISVAAKCTLRMRKYDASNWYAELGVTPY